MMQSSGVLRCDLCNKPFDRISALKRHGYYCRSRRAGHPARLRSCIPCAKSKTRCDNKRPQCSTCIKKAAIECCYPVVTRRARLSKHQDPEDTLDNRQESTSPSDNRQETNNSDALVVNSTQAVPDLNSTNLEQSVIGWNDPNLDLATLFDDYAKGDLFQFTPRTLQSPNHHQMLFGVQEIEEQQHLSSFDTSIPMIPTDNIRSLVQRPRVRPGTQRIASLMLHNLKSYPFQMLGRDAFPPFIHPHAISSEVLKPHMEPLHNCISLMHMLSYDIQGNKKLFWKNVRLECERFRAEHLEMNGWQLLASMQALSIYTLVRLLEGETEHNNLDFLLLATVTAVAKRLTYGDTVHDSQSVTSTCTPQTRWEKWIFQESIRRLCVIYRIVNMLVFFDPAAMCTLQTDLILAPLPAHKRVWEAPDEAAWKTENEKKPEVTIAFGLAASGELVKLEEDQLCRNGAAVSYELLKSQDSSGGNDNWAEWCSGMDELGGLVMLAASLTV